MPEKISPDSATFSCATRNPCHAFLPVVHSVLSTQHSVLSTEIPGGEGGIRTLEGCYTLPAFQASALDQLCDLSVLKGL